MKIKKNAALRKIGRQYRLVISNDDNHNVANVYTMNATAAFLWEKIGTSDFDTSLLADWLCEHYDVERSEAEADMKKLVEEWKNLGLII